MDDTLKEGQGADRFQLSQGTDHILDFKAQHGDNIHTTLHNTSLEALLNAQPDLLS